MRNLIIFIHLFCTSLLAADYSKQDIIIRSPILKVPTEDSSVGAGYMKIFNNSNKAIAFLGIKSNISEVQEIHEVLLQNNVYKMRAVSNGILIKPGQELLFKPKSYHIMFYNINAKLLKNNKVEAHLIFSNNIEIPIKFNVNIGTSKNKHKHH